MCAGERGVGVFVIRPDYRSVLTHTHIYIYIERERGK